MSKDLKNPKRRQFMQLAAGSVIPLTVSPLAFAAEKVKSSSLASPQKTASPVRNATKIKYQVFSNGTIYIDSQRKVKSLAVANGKVCALDEDPAKFKDAQVIDLKGGTAYPGYNDSHVHLVEAGFGLSGVDVQGCTTSAQMAPKIAALAKTLPEGAPIIGEGFAPQDYNAWSLQDLATLDEATGNRPAMFVDNLGHNGVVNSAMLKLAGITAQTKVPMGGKVIVQNGKPTGMLRESAMTLASIKLFPLFSEDVFRKGALKFFELWASMGYTSVVDLMGAPMGRILKPEMCMDLERQGLLPLRVFYMYTFARLDEIDDAMAYAGKSTDMVRFSGLKIFVDGAYAGGMAWTKEKNKKGTNGLYYVYTDDSYGQEYNINRIVEKVNDLGLNIHYHVQGDMAVEAVLDALDKAKEKKGFLTSTHTLIHVAFPTPEQIARMKKLSPHVVTTVQPAFWKVEEDSDRYYGQRAKGAYPVRQIMDAGVSTGISTDFSVSPLELSPPTVIMNISMTGSGDPADHKPLTMQELLQGLAQGSATTVASPDTGKLEVGYWADFVVYDQDLYSVPPDKFSKDNPKVMSTWVGGRQVYQG